MKERIAEIREQAERCIRNYCPHQDDEMEPCYFGMEVVNEKPPWACILFNAFFGLLTSLEEAEKVMKNAVAWTETPEGRAVPQVNGQPGEWIRAARRWLEGEG